MKKTIWIATVMAGVLAAQDSRTIEDQKKLEVQKKLEAFRVLDDAAGHDVFQSTIEAQKVVLNGQSFEFVAGIMQGPLVKNAPYAAEAVTESTQKLFDGNQIVRKTSTKQYRDSEGRERREESMGAVLITDPVDKVRLTLRPETKTFEKQPYRVPQVFTIATNDGGKGFYVNGGEPGKFVTVPVVEGKGRSGGGVGKEPLKAVAIRVGGGEPKQEDLGTRIVEGVQAQGTRTTRIIPAGDIGNLRPIEVVDERWYSPDLQLAVMTRHSDPREGETVFRLTNIQRIEQVRSLFEVPSDYTAPAATKYEQLKTKARSR